MARPVFITSLLDQQKTVEKLIEESRPDNSFYLLLSVSTFIATSGLLLGNSIVIIGGMLVAPLLIPLLSLGMGIATSSRDAITRSVTILFKAFVFAIATSFVTAFLFNIEQMTEQIVLASTSSIFFFLIAFAAGIAAAFSWVKQNMSATLPGIAVAVSLIPPLATIGIGISLFSRDLITGSITLFLLNTLGVVLASIIVFSLFGYSNVQHIQEAEIKKERVRKRST